MSRRWIVRSWWGDLLTAVDAALEGERNQLPLWLAVAFGGGIAAWFALPGPRQWQAFLAFAGALLVTGLALRERRSGQAMAWAAAAMIAGCALIWTRAEWVRAPRIERPMVASFDARIDRVERLVARDSVRLTLTPGDPALPPRVRVSVRTADASPRLVVGAQIRLRARLVPPPQMALPGGHDFARDAWFAGIGATGRALDPPEVVVAGSLPLLDGLRDRLHDRIRTRLPESSGGIATALATGDQGAVGEEDAEAMRRSGLAHLLSVSGLHIAAVIGAAMFVALRLLALSERLALRLNLVVVSGGFGALAGIGYTLLTGAQVPTVRSCIAAILVLIGMALGREAISLRLIAVGVLVVLLLWPESLPGASFQLSFAAVTAIVVLHEWPRLRQWLAPREEGWPMRLGRGLAAMAATGLAVEIALMPFALYHFHRAGLLGVAANILAIPLTTFVIMPLEALALMLDSAGLGAPAWWATGIAIDLLLAIAHRVSAASGAVVMLPAMPGWAFAAMVAGGLWLALWRSRWRLAGLVPAAAGAIGAATATPPDLLVTGDGRHLALIVGGEPALLRERSGDFIRSAIGEAAGFDGEALLIDAVPGASCTRDTCTARVTRDGRSWTILATRSRTHLEWRDLTAACAAADIVVSERRLPRSCTPRWLKLGRDVLGETGAIAIRLGSAPQVDSVAGRVGGHPWR